MKRDYFISVAMATYNGEKYITEQIDSILKQLSENDELIISDDGSTDKTIKIIEKYKDKRIKLLKGPHNGVKQNFANAITNCKGKYIFLSDQDDVWLEKKVDKVLNTFENEKCTCVLHDNIVFDSASGKTIIESFFKYRHCQSGALKNIIKNSYIGCCMAFSREIIDEILPIPNKIEMHDQWIGIISDLYGKTSLLEEKLIKYRRHDSNVSEMKHYGIAKMITNRVNLISELLKRRKK